MVHAQQGHVGRANTPARCGTLPLRLARALRVASAHVGRPRPGVTADRRISLILQAMRTRAKLGRIKISKQ